MPVTLFLVTRLGICIVAYLAVPLIPDATSPPPYHLRGRENSLIDVFGSRWDAGFYVSIAEEGYFYEDVALPSVAFFPLLPLIMRAATPLLGDTVIAGILVSNLALLLATIVFYRLVSEMWDAATADRAVWYWLIFPTAFFGAAIYTESLFLLVAIGSLYFARRGYWEIAALLGVAATLTRFVGVLVPLMLFVEWLQQRRQAAVSDQPPPSGWALLAPMVALLGIAGYAAYLWQAFGDPLAFIKGAAAWDRVPQTPLITLTEQLQAPAEGWWTALLAGRVHVDNWFDFAMAALFLALGVVLLYKRRWAEGAFVVAGVAFTMSSGLLMSQRRYVWVLFPAFILLAQWGERVWVDRLVTTLSLLGLALLTALFANGYWVG